MSLGLHTLLGCHLGALDVERGKEGCVEMACALFLEGVPCSGCTWARAEPFGPKRDCIGTVQWVSYLQKECSWIFWSLCTAVW